MTNIFVVFFNKQKKCGSGDDGKKGVIAWTTGWGWDGDGFNINKPLSIYYIECLLLLLIINKTKQNSVVV